MPAFKSSPFLGTGDPHAVFAAEKSTVDRLGDQVVNTLPPVIGTLLIVIDGGGWNIVAGVKADVTVPFAFTITQATLLADQSGSITIDIWKGTYADFPPTVAGTITAAAKPMLSAAIKSQDSTLSGWTTAVNGGDTLRFNVDSASICQRASLALQYTRN